MSSSTEPVAVRGVWAELAARTDPLALRPRLAHDIEVNRLPARGGDEVVVANPRDRVYFRVTSEEADVLALMDGTRSVAELAVERLRADATLDVTSIATLSRQLDAGGFLATRYLDVDAALARALRPRLSVWSRVRRFLGTLSVEWKGADRLVRWLYRHGLRVAFTTPGKVLAALIALAGFVAFIAVGRDRGFSLTGQSLGLGLVILLALDVVIVFIHELGHAALLVHYGRRVNGAGVRLYFGTPAFFIESSDALMLNRRQRIAQSFAGPYFELVAAGLAALVLVALPTSGAAEVLYRFCVLNYFVLFLNLIPLLELDGYWILSDALRMPDLRPRSLAFVRRDLWVKLRRRERLSRSEVGLGFYGVVGVAFTIFTVSTAFFFWERTFGDFVTTMWDAGAPGIAGLALLVLVLGGPIVRATIDATRAIGRRIRGWWRTVRFRTQRRWRVEAARLLDDLPLFDDLPVEALNDIAGRVRLRTLAEGEAAVREGERADAFYVVRRGTLDVVTIDPESREERVLRSVGRGEAFGELALLENARRSATVRATCPAELFEIDKGTFERLLAARLVLADLEHTASQLQELRELGPFTDLSVSELDELVTHGSWRAVAPDEEIIRQGEPGDAFYVLANGHLQVSQDDQHLRDLHPGDHFGEIALLLDIPRTATVRALTPARVYRLDRQGFDAIVAAAFRRGRLRTPVAVDLTRDH